MWTIYPILFALLALVGAPGPIPRCAGSCLARKIQEAPQLAPQCTSTDFHCFCSTPNFVAAYDNCLHDHCANPAEISVAQQAGAAFCSSGQVPGAGATVPPPGVTPSGVVSGAPLSPASASAASVAGDASSLAASAASQASVQALSATGRATSASAASQTASSLSSQAAAVASSIVNAASSNIAGASATLASLSSGLSSANAAATSARSAGERLQVPAGFLSALFAAFIAL